MEFRNKIVVVTGGSSGIGQAICDEFSGFGAEVFVLDVKPLSSSGPKYCHVDIRDEQQIRNALGEFEAIDVLVNCAGVYIQKYVEETTKEELDFIVDTNLKGTYLVIKNALPLVRKAQGSIINISSGLGIAPELSSPAYCATKAGIIMLTKVLAQQLASEGIRVNVVLPGPIDTPLLRNSLTSDDEMKAYADLNPMKRIGKPIDVANVVTFLASAKAEFVTGGIYSVDGGESTSSLYSK